MIMHCHCTARLHISTARDALGEPVNQAVHLETRAICASKGRQRIIAQVSGSPQDHCVQVLEHQRSSSDNSIHLPHIPWTLLSGST